MVEVKVTRSLSQAAGYVAECLRHYGPEVSPSSRFAQLRDAVCNDDGSSRGHISEKDSDFETVREALRDISQLEFFFDQIRDDPDTDKYEPILKRIISDSVLPQNDTKNSHGRDAQAEAFAFAVCKRAGMNPAFEEPDVTCRIGSQRFGIAVKRIKSHPQLQKRLKEAAKQIQRAGLPGIISAEVSLALNPENFSIMTNQDESEVRRWWKAKQREIVEQWDRRLREGLGSKGVIGVILHEHCAVRLNGKYLLRTMNYGIETVSNSEYDLWSGFWKTFTQGLPNPQR